MGDWNATCGISGLPIERGTKTLLFLLTPGKAQHNGGPPPADGTTYPDDLWRPVVWPILGNYDERGLIERIKITAPTLFCRRLQGLKSRTTNEDAAFFNNFKKSLTRESQTGERLYDGKLQHHTPYGDRALGHVLVRHDVWTAFLQIKYKPWYESEGLSREEAHSAAEQYLRDYLAWLRKPKDPRELFGWTHQIEEHKNPFVRQWSREARWFDHLLDDALRENVEAGQKTALEAAYQVADLLHARNLMGQLRMSWHPGTGRGSQEADWPTHQALHSAVLCIARSEQEKAEAEEDC